MCIINGDAYYSFRTHRYQKQNFTLKNKLKKVYLFFHEINVLTGVKKSIFDGRSERMNAMAALPTAFNVVAGSSSL